MEEDDNGNYNRDAVFILLCITLHQLWSRGDKDAATRESLSEDSPSGWTAIEIQALNAYVDVLPQFSVMVALREAWEPMAAYYYRKTQGSKANTDGQHPNYYEGLEESQVSPTQANLPQTRPLSLLNSGFSYEPPTAATHAALYQVTWGADGASVQAPVANTHGNWEGDAELTGKSLAFTRTVTQAC